MMQELSQFISLTVGDFITELSQSLKSIAAHSVRAHVFCLAACIPIEFSRFFSTFFEMFVRNVAAG